MTVLFLFLSACRTIKGKVTKMAQIQVQDLTFYYDGSSDLIFDHASFRLDTSWRLGLIGRNGKGKTTLLRLLMGELEHGGSIYPKLNCSYFPYPVVDKEAMTMEVLEACSPDYELWKVCRELSLMDVDTEILSRSFATLSGGEQTKVLLALLFSREEDFLLIDEPTNHLDMEARQQVMEYLRKKSGFILVSHDRHFLDGCVDHILAIEREKITVMQGNYTAWWEEKEKKDQEAVSKNERLKKEIGRLEETAHQKENWSQAVEKTKLGTRTGGLRPDRGFIGHKSAKMMKRAKTLEHRMESQIEEKKGLLDNLESIEELKLFPLYHHKDVLLRARDTAFFYGEKQVLSGFSMELENGQQLALCGKNGCGKSTVLKKILGEEIGCRGTWELASGLTISYVPQDVSSLSGSLDTYMEEYGISPTLMKAMLRKLDFSREQFQRPMEQYSQGQKKKVVLARSLCEQAHLYVWDEPLNYIDLFSRMQIAELIRRFQPTLLLVEHDRSFLEEIDAKCLYLGN